MVMAMQGLCCAITVLGAIRWPLVSQLIHSRTFPREWHPEWSALCNPRSPCPHPHTHMSQCRTQPGGALISEMRLRKTDACAACGNFVPRGREVPFDALMGYQI
ncbi:hypothetical protein F5148DRAFT_1209158 [Russula earlei]|uniref:Uncharacterized protein n=1 Tax=Russula earlei TaxID=71964 RepID=A0ACC0U650_9AGAM|nr:hypothetical protein F5148DRAFT_1209158 [Russula earlei]